MFDLLLFTACALLLNSIRIFYFFRRFCIAKELKCKTFGGLGWIVFGRNISATAILVSSVDSNSNIINK